MPSSNRLIILDRDGVINQDSDNYIKTVDEWQALPGSLEAIGRLTKAGYSVAVATNQSGIGRGYYTEQTLLDMHEKMIAQTAQHGGEFCMIEYCPHTPDDHCTCRKPKPGMLLTIAETVGCEPADITMIGDSYRDLEAGWAINANSLLVKTGKGRRTLENHTLPATTAVFEDLAAATHSLLQE